jgi:hypothetical protein
LRSYTGALLSAYQAGAPSLGHTAPSPYEAYRDRCEMSPLRWNRGMYGSMAPYMTRRLDPCRHPVAEMSVDRCDRSLLRTQRRW